MVPKKLDLVVFVLCLLCPIVLCEREREKCLEAEKMKENENPCETLKCLRAGFFFFYVKGWVEFGYIVFRLNRPQLVFS